MNAPVPDPALTQPDPDGGVEMTDGEWAAFRGEGDPNAGVGWYEFITPTATTGIAYVHESGDIFVPDGGWGPTEPFHLAASRGKVHRLIRADSLDVPQMASAIVDHLLTDTLDGDSETLICGGCGHVLVTGDPDGDRDPQAEHAAHHATLMRAAILGTDQ